MRANSDCDLPSFVRMALTSAGAKMRDGVLHHAESPACRILPIGALGIRRHRGSCRPGREDMSHERTPYYTPLAYAPAMVGRTPGISCERPICSTLVCFIPLLGALIHTLEGRYS